MVTQELINRIQDLLRQQYILIKDEEIRRLLALYNGSIDYLISLLLLNSSFQSGNLDSTIARTVNEALTNAKPQMESGYDRALRNMIDVGASALTVVMLEGRQRIGSKTQIKVESLVENGATRLLNEGGAASAVFGEDIDNKTKSVAKAITKNVANVQNPTLSENIWGESSDEILSIIKDGFREGLSPYNVAEKIKTYSLSGDGFKNAFRLAYTELTHAHSVAQVEAIRAWNSDPVSEFKLLIEQYLSPMHRVYCICDVLAGVYDPSKPIPKIPRHPNCNCGQRTLIDNPTNRKRVMSVDERIRAADLDEDFEVLKDINNEISKKGIVTQSSNKWNAQMEYITQKLKGEEQQKALQALANEVDLNDPVGKTVSNMLERLYGVKRQGGTSSSSGIVKTANDVSINGQKLNLTQQEVDFINQSGVKITTQPVGAADANSYGSYDIQSNTLFFNPTTLSAEAQNTFIHELGHAIDTNLGTIGNKLQRQLLSLKDEFNKVIRTPAGSLSSDANYIIMRRALGLTGDDGLKIQRYIISNTPYTEIPADLRITASNLRGYFETPQELFAEGYMLFRTDARFREFAPNLYNYYNNLTLNLF